VANPASATRRPDSLAALDAKARRLLPLFGEAKQQEQEHTARVVAARARLAEMPAAIVTAAATPAQVAKLGQERAALAQLLADADLVARGLAERTRAAGLEWSSAWTAWKDALEVEILGDLPGKRAAFEAREAAARAAFEAKLAEMPAS